MKKLARVPTRDNARSIDEYIKTFAPPVQKVLQEIRKAIRAAAPQAKETISYQIPTFDLHGNLVHFAGHAHHVGFYPGPSGIMAFAGPLAAYATSRGTVQFPLDEPLPLGLIRKIVEFRVNENVEREAERQQARTARRTGRAADAKAGAAAPTATKKVAKKVAKKAAPVARKATPRS